MLGFAGSWGFPLVVGVLAGDMFSSEDRYGTWKTVLTRSCTREHVFVGKLLAAMTFATRPARLDGGLEPCCRAAAGRRITHSLGWAGSRSAPAGALFLVTASWALTVLPVLAFTSLAILFSVATRSGIAGVLGPAIVALLTQLLGLVGTGVWAHTLLIGSTFDLWHGLFAARPFYGPLVVAGSSPAVDDRLSELSPGSCCAAETSPVRTSPRGPDG